MNNPDNYPQIQAFKDAINTFNIRFEILETDDSYKDIDYRKIAIILKGVSNVIPVGDEYGDVDTGKPLVLLQLVLQECEFYEDADDFLEWCRDLGIDSSLSTTREIHFHLREIVPKIRSILGDLHAIPTFDMELNTGLAQALRND